MRPCAIGSLMSGRRTIFWEVCSAPPSLSHHGGRDFHSVIGSEARAQILKAEGKLPAAIICLRGWRIELYRHLP